MKPNSSDNKGTNFSIYTKNLPNNIVRQALVIYWAYPLLHLNTQFADLGADKSD